jgi:hypothetical protein
MSDRKRNVLDACLRMEYFNQANPQLKTELPYTLELFAANKAAIDGLQAAGITLVSAGGAGLNETRSKAARAEEIEDDLRLIVKTARQIAQKIEGFPNTFTLPRGGLTYQQLVESAKSFIADASAQAAEFAKRGLTAGFFDELAAAVAEFEDTAHEQADAKRTTVGANADTEAILRGALDTRRELKTALENHYRRDPAKLAEWLTASHVRRRSAETPPPAPVAPVG